MATLSVNQNQQLDSLFISGLQLEQMPEIYRSVMNRYPIDYDMRVFDFMTRRPYKETKQVKYTHKERGRHNRKLFVQGSGVVQNITINPATGGSPVTVSAAVFTVSPTSMYTDPTRLNNFLSPVRVNDMLEIATGNLTVVVLQVNTTTNPHTFAVVSLDAGVTPAQIVAAVPANGQVINFGRVRGEGHNTGKGIIPEGDIFENEVHYLEHGFNYTDVSTATKSWFRYENPEQGKSGEAYFIEAEYQQFVRFNRMLAQVLFFSKRNTAGIPDYTTETGMNYQSTDGLFTLARKYGLFNYPSGNLTMAYFDSLIQLLNKRVCPKENLVMYGLDWMLMAKDFLVDFFKNGAITYGAFDATSAKNMNINFDSVAIAGYKFVFRQMELFNDDTMFGSDAFKYKKSALICPMDESLQTIDGSQQTVNSITLRYLDLKNFYDEHFRRGGGSTDANGTRAMWISDNPATDKTIRKMNYVAKIGVQVFGQDRFILSEPI